MKNKFDLSLKENIFVAKKLLIQNIYNSAKLEGCNVTFPQTQTILDGVSVAGLKMSDVEVILNLRNAWKFVLSTIEHPLTLEYMNKINEHISRNESLEWGVLRYGMVGISGTSYQPPIPVEEDVINSLARIAESTKCETEKGIELFLYACRSQNYWDGNKRTATLLANKYLIMSGKGILTVPEANLNEFNRLLVNYYETGDQEQIKGFLYEYSLQGMVIDQDFKLEYSKEQTTYNG